MGHGLAKATDLVSLMKDGPNWHGLGVLAKQITKELLLEHNILFEVIAKPSYVNIDGEQVATGDLALYRADRKVMVGTAKAAYRVHQITDYYERSVVPMCEKHGLTLASAAALFDGSRFFFCAEIPGAILDLGNGDVSQAYVTWASSFDQTLSNITLLDTVRKVCNNTLMLGIQSAKAMYSQKHSGEFSHENSNDWLTAALDSWGRFKAEAERLRAAGRSPIEHQLFVTELLQPALLLEAFTTGETTGEIRTFILEKDADERKFQEAFDKEASRTVRLVTGNVSQQTGGDDGSMWSSINAVTHWTDHLKGRSVPTRIYNSMFGDDAKLKTKALHLALEYVDKNHGKTDKDSTPEPEN